MKNKLLVGSKLFGLAALLFLISTMLLVSCDGDGGSTPVDNDNDGFYASVDCDDDNPAINPGAAEICGNNIDEDCSGVADTCQPPVDTTAAAGLWYGTLTDDGTLTMADFGGGAPIINTHSLAGITSTDGQFRFVIEGGGCIGTEFEGTYSMNGDVGSGDFTAYAGGYCSFNNNPDGVIGGTIEFTVAGNILTGTYVSQDASGTFSLTYDPQVETPLTLADLEGTWIVENAGYEGGGLF